MPRTFDAAILNVKTVTATIILQHREFCGPEVDLDRCFRLNKLFFLMLNGNPESNSRWVERFTERMDVLNDDECGNFAFSLQETSVFYFCNLFIEIT